MQARLLVMVAALATTLVTSSARAQSALVPVSVRNDRPGITHSLWSHDGTLVAQCDGDCVLTVPRGTYIFESSDTEELRQGKMRVDIIGPTTVDVSPGSKWIRTLGLVTGVVGSATAFVALGGLFHESCPLRVCGEPNYTPWFITLAVGGSIAATGWVLFGSSSTKIHPAASPGTVSLRATPAPGGGIFGATFAF